MEWLFSKSLYKVALILPPKTYIRAASRFSNLLSECVHRIDPPTSQYMLHLTLILGIPNNNLKNEKMLFVKKKIK